MVTLGIVAFMFALAAPNFAQWLQNTQIRTAGETLLGELQAARALALKGNSAVRFQMMSSMDSTCAESKEGANWIVSADLDLAGKCDVADPEMLKNIMRYKAGNDTTKNVKVSASDAHIVFNGLGQITFPNAAEVTVDLTNPAGGECVANGGKMRCLQVRITRAGQTRMCDPAVTSSSDPRKC